MPIVSDKVLLVITTIAAGILIVLLGISGAFNWVQSNKIETLELDIKNKVSEIAIKDANNITLTSTIKSQNEKIEQIENSYNEKTKEFEIWKNKPPEIKYKEIIKNVEVKSNECKDIKSIIADIRNTSF